METLFRMAIVRPPVEQDVAPIDLTQASDFLRSMDALGESDRTRAGYRGVAATYLGTADALEDVVDLDLGEAVSLFSADLDALEQKANVTPTDVRKACKDRFGGTAAATVGSAGYAADVRRLKDTIVAIKLSPSAHRRPIHRLAAALRDLQVVELAHVDASFPSGPAALHAARRRPLVLPDLTKVGSILRDPPRVTGDVGEDDARRHRTDELLGRYRELQGAIGELGAIDGSLLGGSPVRGSAGHLPPEALRPAGILARELAGGPSGLAGMTFDATRLLALATGIGAGRSAVDADVDEGATTLRAGHFAAAAKLSGVRTSLTGRPGFEPAEIGQVGFRLDPNVAGALSPATRGAIESRGMSIAALALDTITQTLEAELVRVVGELDSLGAHREQVSLRRIGNSLVMIRTPLATEWTLAGLGGPIDIYLPMHLPVDGRIPHAHGDVEPAGIMDLLIVKQQLTGYEAVDIAHIENVLQGERKVRVHRRRRETEEFTFTETELTTTEERDLESTDRFEMSRETSETIKEESSLKAGLTVSGSYGPVVEFSASVEGSTSSSKEQSTKAASKFAKDVTQRSSSKITERMLKRESLRVTTEVEDTNEHTLDNVGGAGHVIGVYQWVEKVYEAQMFNYGLRLMFDFMVPEPGAFLIETLRHAHSSAIQLEKPPPFLLKPNEISIGTYGRWVAEYGATDVVPPPPTYATASFNYAAGGGDDKTDYTHSASIAIPAGYRAIWGHVSSVKMIWEADYAVDVALGRRVHRMEAGSWTWGTSLDDETGSVPIGFTTNEVSEIAVVAEVKCQRTEHALEQWRHDTHAKLTTAYRARLAEYEEALAKLEAQAGVQIKGMSPAANLELMRDELKKASVSILTEQHFDLFDAIETGSNGLPQIDLYEAGGEGPYVRFFEQAFEWEHMTWITYPYFWGRKEEWTARVAFEDADPLFNQFLKAGFARVSVPVREGFEGAVDHFLTFGEPWMGGPLPSVTSPLYLPIAQEIAERLDRPGDEVPVGDPWEVRLPTSLVRLRDDGSLPAWAKDGAGNWVEQ